MSDNKSDSQNYPIALIIASLIIIIAGLMYAAAIATPFFMALFISVVCAQPVIWLQSKKVPQWLAVTIVLFGIIGIFVGFGELIANSLSSFSEDAPKYEENLNAIGKSIFDFFHQYGINLNYKETSKLFDPTKVMSFTATALGQLGTFMGNAFTIFFLALFLLLEIDDLQIKTSAIVKDSNLSLGYISSIIKNIRHYLSIKTLTSLLTGLPIWICLTIIGVDYAIIWALIAFLLNYIPNIGSIIAAVPAVLFALVQLGFGGALWTTASFLAVNMFVGSVLEPKMMGQGLGLSTYVVFLSLIFWGFIMGTVGMFLSVPLTMAIKIILEQNPRTKWIAILLGTRQEAEAELNTNKPY